MSDPTMPEGGEPWVAPGSTGPDPSTWAPPPVQHPPTAGYGGPPPPGYGPAAKGFAPPSGYAPPPQGFGPPGYGAPSYVSATEHPQGTVILVLGILGFVSCGLLGPVAWFMGSKAIREIDAARVPCTNRSQVQIGRVLGIVTTVLVLLGILAFVLLVVVLGATAATTSS